MKVLFDHQIFTLQRFGGISRYFTELIYELNKGTAHQAVSPIEQTTNIHYNEKIGKPLDALARLKLMLMFKFSKKKIDRYYVRTNRNNTIKLLRAQKFDLFVPTYYDVYFLPFLGDKPFVLNVYDMIHELFPSYFTADDLATRHKGELIRKATKIIAISENTKKDIIKFYPEIDERKIEVVYLAHSMVTEEVVDLGLPSAYVLFVGNRGGYKNFTFFVKALAPVLVGNSHLQLVCAGGNAFNQDEIDLIQSLGVMGQVQQRNFNDFELATYYKSARCFVFPSAYEGFGIPVLEAMSCGCPVILANHSSFPEVAGEAGIYFELDNQADLTTKISTVLTNDEVRADFIKKGLLQAKKFSWEKTAEHCIKVFNLVHQH